MKKEMKEACELEWGLRGVEIAAPALWGARMIKQEDCEPEVLWDRQAFAADTVELRDALKDKLNGGALPKFLKWARTRFYEQDEKVEVVAFDGVEFSATTNASYGYLYVTAAIALSTVRV